MNFTDFLIMIGSFVFGWTIGGLLWTLVLVPIGQSIRNAYGNYRTSKDYWSNR